MAYSEEVMRCAFVDHPLLELNTCAPKKLRPAAQINGENAAFPFQYASN